MKQGLFVLDLDRCTGCAACVVACNIENSVSEGLSWRRIHTYNLKRLAREPVFHYSLACNHCLEPACLDNCPANAYSKDPSTGSVVLDQQACMGCRYCIWVCPYEAPRYGPEAGVVEKCNFCADRLSGDGRPACVAACPTDALKFEWNADPPLVDRSGFPETGLRPAIRIEEGRRRTPPLMTAAPVSVDVVPPPPEVDWIDLKAEWSLWLFSSLAMVLVSWFTASTATGTTLRFPVFALTGLAAMSVSALHLGRITRIWRAILNIRRSWISREAALFSVFFAAACAIALRPGFAVWVQWTVSGIGCAAMYAMDMVYRIPGQRPTTVPHSAMATLSVALYIGILTLNPVLLWPAAVVKLVLYLIRQERPVPGGTVVASIRIGVGLLPAMALAAGNDISIAVALIGAVIGELIDRAEFYASLRFLTPGRQIASDLARRQNGSVLELGPAP